MKTNKIKMYDSLTKQIKEITTNHIKVYVCGPTLYNYCHIGHGRSFIIFDTFKHMLTHTFDKCTVVQNTTDIAESITQKAQKEQCTEKEIVAKYRQSYIKDLRRLNITGIDIYDASNFIPDIIEHIQTMIDNGDAYIAEDGVYFKTENFNYDLFENRTDNCQFALWKTRENGFNSPWGVGIPGWHIECTTMSTKILGNRFHIHGGGSDLQYPHHQNEIVQSFSLCNNRSLNKHSAYPAECWMHNGMLNINEEKMSKSLGNCKFIKDLVIDDYTADIFRYLVLKTQYSETLSFSDDEWHQSQHNIDLIRKFYFKNINNYDSNNNDKNHIEILHDNFQTPLFIQKLHNEMNYNKISTVFNMIKLMNFYMNSRTLINKGDIEKLIEERNEYKKLKDYLKADEIRQILLKNFVAIEDQPQKTIWYYL